MAYVDDATINAIRRKHPIREIVERYVNLTKKGEDYWGLCPFHPDNHASMSVSTKLDMFQCFSCHKAGNIFNFIAGMENISYGEAINLLAREDGYDIGPIIKHTNPHTKDYEIISLASKFYQNNLNSTLGTSAIKYLNDFKMQPFDYSLLVVHTQDFLRANFYLLFLIIMLVWLVALVFLKLFFVLGVFFCCY